ncbi:MAG: B12-binding domain-containing radical SAM protein [Deltaproteobacteria bacterium]|nr:B12-binding domain-containing radical SAM protein [Deltaproteobacteria bacterium]
MIKLLLIKATNNKVKSGGDVTPPLGIMYLASYLSYKMSDKIQIKILDTRLYPNVIQIVNKYMDNFKPDIVGISAITLEAENLLKIANFIKSVSSKIPVIVGGPHVSYFTENIIDSPYIDFGVIDEGEITFYELITALNEGGNFDDIKGIAFKKDGRIIKTQQRPYMVDLDALPFPSWDLIEYDKYSKLTSQSNIGVRPYMSLLTSRGCPFHCIFCYNIRDKKFRARTPLNVINEMKVLTEKYKIRDFEIIDDVANFDRNRYKDIFKNIISNALDVRLSFPTGIRVDLLDEETISLMKKAGTAELTVAIETASKRLQRLIHKNINLEKAERLINYAASQNLFVRGTFVFGFPTETKEEIKSTINFACKLKLQVAIFLIATPFPGTEILRQFEISGKSIEELNSTNFDFHGVPFNGSNVPDKEFFRLYHWAYARFYLNPARILLILKTKSMWNDLLIRALRVFRYIFFSIK